MDKKEQKAFMFAKTCVKIDFNLSQSPMSKYDPLYLKVGLLQ